LIILIILGKEITRERKIEKFWEELIACFTFRTY
jgi:hypothetical protein